MSDETLYDRLGGETAIGAVVEEFYDRVLADERVAHHFSETDMADQRAHQTAFLSAVTGGPMRYDGDEMGVAHEGMGITATEFDAVATHLDDALAEFDVDDADREAVIAEVASYRNEIVENA
ncbi:group I truncated hemoglobin [Halorubrum sp. DTA98]|uniref:group I truncated hemoglobin n=1 Tax=Halorubrum sp. DTA98 TaxID=3402163 RepID=UPI003AAC0362